MSDELKAVHQRIDRVETQTALKTDLALINQKFDKIDELVNKLDKLVDTVGALVVVSERREERDKHREKEIERMGKILTELQSDNGKFKEYIAKKLEVNDIVVPLYQNIQFRKYKWYAFINKKRSEDNMLNIIEKKYSKDHTIIIGDWSIGKQMRNFISTPNLSLKRKLKERFKVYNIDEFRTSCLSYKTKNLCKNLYLPDKKGEERKIHSILTYQMENNRKGCINRDKNGCKNIRYVFNYYKKTGKRPMKYSREYKFERIASTTETKVEVVKCANA